MTGRQAVTVREVQGHHVNSGEDVDRGHFVRPHVGDVANRRS